MQQQSRSYAAIGLVAPLVLLVLLGGAERGARPWPLLLTTVLLTLRTAALSSHAGQIAFPGGKIEPSDASPLAAALREACEEVGLDRSLADPIGYLDLYLTFSGFRILPLQIEFWSDGAHRLHDRILFARDGLGDPWTKTRLYP